MKPLINTLLATVFAVALVTQPAYARDHDGDRDGRGERHERFEHREHRHGHEWRRHEQPYVTYYQPAPVYYYPPQPVVYYPQPVYYTEPVFAMSWFFH